MVAVGGCPGAQPMATSPWRQCTRLLGHLRGQVGPQREGREAGMEGREHAAELQRPCCQCTVRIGGLF